MQFIYPYFLYALLFVAIPILLHLLRFRKYKKVYFSNVRFLQTLDIEQKKRSQLRNLLILLARILTIIALVLAFAQAYIPKKNMQQTTQGQKYVSIYIDNSFSMEAGGQESSLLDEAKQYAKQTTDAYSLADKFQLLTNDFAGENQRFMSKEDFWDALENVEYSPVPRTWAQIRARQKDAFEAAFVPKDGQFSYIISDFQKGSLQLSSFAQEDSLQTICLMPISSVVQDNIGIDSIYLDAPIMEKGRESILSVCLRNTSDRLQEKISVKLTLQGKTIAVLNVDIPPNAVKVVKFPLKIQEAKWHYASVEINDFPIVYDNKMYFSFPVKESIKILQIYGETPNTALQKLYSQDSSFSYQSVQMTKLNYADIAKSDFIILDELRQISSALTSDLEKTVLTGSKVCFIPAYMPNGLLEAGVETCLSQLAKVQYLKFDTAKMQVQKIQHEHLLFKTAFDKIPEQMQLPYARGYYPIKNTVANVRQNLLTFQNHSAFFAEIQREKGFVYIFASPLEEKYTDFCSQSLFVVAFLNMALISSVQEHSINIGDEEVVYVENVNTALKETVVCKALEGDLSMMPEIKQIGGNLGVLFHNQIQKDGHYLLLAEKDTLAILAFNYNRKESTNEFFTKDELRQMAETEQMPNIAVLSPQKQDVKKQIEALSKGLELWKIFLIFALVFILSEILLIRLWK